MRRLPIVLVLALVGCSAPAPLAESWPSAVATPQPEASIAYALDRCPDGSMPIPQRFRAEAPNVTADGCVAPRPSAPTVPFVQPPHVPTPDAALRANAFPVGVQPALRRATVSEMPSSLLLRDWARGFMDRLDQLRGSGPHAGRIGPASDDEWNSYVWPGPFQKIVRATVAAKPRAGRFFHLESWRIDAAYVLPWNGLQFIDATITFRDHAETPPAEGEVWYTWHVRLPSTNTGATFAIADGYDASGRAFTRTEPFWTPSLLEQEATSAAAGYLWNESYISGGHQQFANVRDTTPFWHARIESLNHLNALFAAGTLTERRFENVGVRIDRFDPLTYFGGGVVTATISGRLIEVVNGKTVIENFTQPMKFFRFGSSGASISGWSAVDAFQDGAWVSGGNLALDKLETSHG